MACVLQVELQEIVDFFTKPERFRESGSRIPRGVLLCGPPGTGKTLLARCAERGCRGRALALGGCGPSLHTGAALHANCCSPVQGGGRRGGGDLHCPQRLRVCRDVCGCWRLTRAGPLLTGKQL